MISSIKLRPVAAGMLFVLMLSGLCGASAAAEEVTVFAAASVTDAFKVSAAGIFLEDLHSPITYPAALVEGKAVPAAARFLDFLKTRGARAVLEKFGFTVR